LGFSIIAFFISFVIPNILNKSNKFAFSNIRDVGDGISDSKRAVNPVQDSSLLKEFKETSELRINVDSRFQKVIDRFLSQLN
jgi:hypothetical protein